MAFVAVYSSPLTAQIGLPSGRTGGVRPFDQFVVNDWARNVSNDEKKHHGSPYLFDDWVPSDITTIDGQVFRDVRIKYNLFYGFLMYQPLNSKDSSIVKDERVKTFSLKTKDSTYVFEKYLVPIDQQTEQMEEFFILLDSGTYLLLIQPQKRLQESVSSALTAASSDETSRYVDEVAYFIRKPDRTVMEIRPPKKYRASIFGDHYRDLSNFVKRNKLSWKKHDDLIRIVNHLNQNTPN